MRLTWQYGKRIHEQLSLQWTHWVENGIGISRYMVWNNQNRKIILDIMVTDV